MSTKKKPGYSLAQPSAMGGIYGGDGYTYQDRYIVCHIPIWIAQGEFLRIMAEATGDVDVVFRSGRKHVYEHIQIKDHHIDLSEFKTVLDGFVKIAKGMRAYRKFTLAAPSIHPKLKSCFRLISRYCEAKKFYAKSDASVLKTTLADIKQRLVGLGLGRHIKFLLEQVELDIGRLDFGDNSTCKGQFLSALMDHPKYREKVREVLSPAYAAVLAEILAHRGKVLELDKLHALIDGSITGQLKGARSVLYLHNWTVEKYDLKATYTVDWSSLFDRAKRSVPDADIWNKKLVPELYKLRQKISNKTPNREIAFRGKCALSSGIALGMAFPDVGNWNFEVLQNTQVWRSDAPKIPKYKLSQRTVDPLVLKLTPGNDLVFVFDITGKADNAVVNYLLSQSIGVKKVVIVQPNTTPSGSSIQNDSEAVSLAQAAKELLKNIQVKYGTHKTHLFFFGPLGLALFLGQKLTSVGTIQLYEFQDPGYKLSCELKS